MDIPLFCIALLTFALLYVGLGFYLLWALIITVMVLIAYLAVHYKHVGENYPYGFGDTLTTIILLSVTYTIFILVGPKPVPFVGAGLTVGNTQWTTVADVAIILIFILFAILAILIPVMQRKSINMGGGGGDGKGAIGVGAG